MARTVRSMAQRMYRDPAVRAQVAAVVERYEQERKERAEQLMVEGFEWLREYERACATSEVITDDMREMRRLALHCFWLANQAVRS